MGMKMYKGQDSEIVNSRDVRSRLNDGWTFNPSTEPQVVVKPHWRQRRRTKIAKADATVINNKQSDLQGPEDFNNRGE